MSKFIHASTKVKGTPDEVWYCFVDHISKWWTKELCTSIKTKKFVIEAILGGMMYEDFGEGEGLVWGHVIGVNKPNQLLVRGNLSADFGGPAVSFDRFTFRQKGKHTIVEYRGEFIGDIEERGLKSLENGWQDILDKYFKPYCESIV